MNDAKTAVYEVMYRLFRSLLTILADSLLLVVWLAGEYVFEHLLVPKVSTEKLLPNLALWLFRIIFMIATVTPVVSLTIKNFRILLAREELKQTMHSELRLLDIKQELQKSTDLSLLVRWLAVGLSALMGVWLLVSHVTISTVLSSIALMAAILTLFWGVLKKIAALRERDVILSLPDVMDANEVGELVANLLEGIKRDPSKS